MRVISRRLFIFFVYCLTLTAMADESRILKVRYTPLEGTDVEYGQGAIERNELSHFPIEPIVWLIRVSRSDEPSMWEKKLNASVDPKHGAFCVELPTEEDLRRVESGEIQFQQ